MPRLFEHHVTVTDAETDPQGHVNNIAYLSWMQSAAIGHSAARGWSPEEYRIRGWAWVVRTHFIEYRRPAWPNDSVTVRTWVADMKKFTSLRKYEILRGEQLLARAETNWAFVETATGRLLSIPEEVATAFEIVPGQ